MVMEGERREKRVERRPDVRREGRRDIVGVDDWVVVVVVVWCDMVWCGVVVVWYLYGGE